MTIPDYLPTICDWCGSHDAGVENPHHPKHGRFLFAFCNDCDWIHEYDRGEEVEPDSYEDFYHDWTTACFDVDAHE